MRKVEKLLADHPDFLAYEIERLIHSAKNRLQQQRIHFAELERYGSERVIAQRQLELMQAAIDKLRDYQKQCERGRKAGACALPADSLRTDSHLLGKRMHG